MPALLFSTEAGQQFPAHYPAPLPGDLTSQAYQSLPILPTITMLPLQYSFGRRSIMGLISLKIACKFYSSPERD